MGRKSNAELVGILLALVPLDGSAIGNERLRDATQLGQSLADNTIN
jgi:hypothetical protein